MFAVTAGYEPDELAKKYESENDDYNAIMIKIIANRLKLTEWLQQIDSKDMDKDHNLKDIIWIPLLI